MYTYMYIYIYTAHHCQRHSPWLLRRWDSLARVCDAAIWCMGVMSHMWMSHVTHVDTSCRTHECVIWQTWMILVAHMNDSYRTHEWVMWQTCIDHVAHLLILPCARIRRSHLMHESCLQCEWPMSHLWLNYITYMNGSCHTHAISLLCVLPPQWSDVWVMSRV